MVQIDLCLLGAGFTGGMLYTTLAKFDSKTNKDYLYSLKSDQLDVYHEIVKERSNLYIQGLFIGTIIAIFFAKMYQDQFEPFTVACGTSAIAMATAFFYYMLMPKSKSMVTLLRDQVQIGLWHKVRQEMQYRYWSGFLLGLIGYALLSYGLLGQAIDMFEDAIGMDVFPDFE